MRVFQCASMACVILGSVGTAHGGAFADFIGKALPQVNWNPAQVNRNPVAYWLVQYESAQRELPEHAALCRAGRESMKDYPYIRKLVALYGDDPQLLPVEVLEDLVEMGAAVEADALYDAVHMPEACRVLAAAGADVNAGEAEQRDTPLHRAASMGCTETCRVLIAAGANPESTGYRNETALYSALNGYHRETARALLSPEAGSRGQLLAKGVRIGLPGAEGVDLNASLAAYAIMGDVAACRELLAAGAAVGGLRIGYYSSLAVGLAAKGEAETLRLLLDGMSQAELAEALHAAVAEERADICAMLLDAGAAAADAREPWNTLLHRAAHSGSLNCVKLLIARGQEVNAVNERGESPLHLAANRGYEEARLLGEVSHTGSSPHYAAVCRVLLAHGAAPNVRDARGRTPLHLAALRNLPDACRALAEAGGDVNARDEDGLVPLHFAYGECLDVLLAAGANPRVPGARGESLLEDAVQLKDADTCRRLLAAGVEPTQASQLMLSVLLGDAEGCKQAIADGVDEAALQEALLEAVAQNRVDLCELLLAAGADPRANNSRALHSAASRGHRDICALLLAAGADVNAPNEAGDTPLTLAAKHADIECCRLLLHSGARVNAAPGGDTPLSWAVYHGDTALCRLLLDAGADPNQRIGLARYALHSAVRYRHLEVCELLLQAGANPQAVEHGQTPADIAKKQNYAPALKLLAPSSPEHHASNPPEK